MTTAGFMIAAALIWALGWPRSFGRHLGIIGAATRQTMKEEERTEWVLRMQGAEIFRSTSRKACMKEALACGWVLHATFNDRLVFGATITREVA